MTSLSRAAPGGVAAAMAMPNLIPSSPGKTVVSAGAANYKGYNALAAGVTYRSENGKRLVNGAASVAPLHMLVRATDSLVPLGHVPG